MKIGDKVKWTSTTTKGGGFNMTTKIGEILEITNSSARIKYKNGRTTVVPFKKLRLQSEVSELTEAFINMGR